MKKLLFGLLSLTLWTTACKKDKDAPAMTKENIAGTYKMIADVFKETGQPDVDDFATAPSCEKDDLFKFNVDGSFQAVDAGESCDPAGGFEALWTVSGNQITVGEQTYTITKFDGSILEIKEWSGTETDGHGSVVTFQ